MNIAYLRVSTEEQNPENQLREVLSLFEDTVKVEVIQEEKSAFKDDFKRDKFNNILELIKQHKVKTFAVWSLDRIYRNRIKLKEFFELCKMYKVQILIFRMPLFTGLEKLDFPEQFSFLKDMVQNMLLEFLGFMAEEESRLKSDRVKIAYKNHKGNAWGRSVLPQEVIRQIIIYYNQNNKPSIRNLVKVGFEYKNKKNEIKKVSHGKIAGIIKDFNDGKVFIKSPLQKAASFINKFNKNNCSEIEQLMNTKKEVLVQVSKNKRNGMSTLLNTNKVTRK